MTRKHNERFRGKTELTVYGRRAVLEALESPTVEVLRLAAVRQVPPAFREELLAACRQRGIEPEAATPHEVGRLSGDPRNDQGIVARVQLLGVREAAELCAAGGTGGPSGPVRLMALDNVTNPQNVGMIVRSVVASGLSGMLWPLAGSPWVNGLIVKSSASSIYRCPIFTTPALAAGLEELKRAGFRVCGLVAGAHAELFSHRPGPRAVYVVGSETEGISREIDSLIDERLSIPMEGGVESLNVAVAASLVCYQARAGAAQTRR